MVISTYTIYLGSSDCISFIRMGWADLNSKNISNSGEKLVNTQHKGLLNGALSIGKGGWKMRWGQKFWLAVEGGIKFIYIYIHIYIYIDQMQYFQHYSFMQPHFSAYNHRLKNS